MFTVDGLHQLYKLVKGQWHEHKAVRKAILMKSCKLRLCEGIKCFSNMSVFDEKIEICWDILKFSQQILNFSSHPSTLQPIVERSAELHRKSEGQV